MAGRYVSFGFVGLMLSLLVLGLLTPVPARLAYPLSLFAAVSVGWLGFYLDRRFRGQK